MPDSRCNCVRRLIGLLSGKVEAGNLLDQIAQSSDPAEIISAFKIQQNMKAENQFFQSGIAGSLTQPVDAAMDHFSPGGYSGQFGRNSHAEIIVSMDFNRQTVSSP